MKVFYSILYIAIRPTAKEQLSLGLFVSDSQRAFFHYSPEKLNLTKKLLPESSFELLKNYLFGLARSIENNDYQKNFLKEEYFGYLSNYSNNLISFSRPVTINVDLNKEVFHKLFEKFVFSDYQVPEERIVVKESPIQYVKKQLYPAIKSHVNLNQTLTPKEIPSLVIPKIKVDFIGRNDNPVAGDTLDFESGTKTLSNKISYFVTLINALEHETSEGKYYIIGKEPSKVNFPEQHETWKQIHHSDQIEFIPLNELESIKQYISEHDVKPFIEK